MRSKFYLSKLSWLLVGLFVPIAGFAEYGMNLTEGVTDLSKEVYDLHMIIFYICVAIGVVVFGVMFWSIFHHRKSKGAVASQFHESTAVEIVWTVVPFIILVLMAIPATKTLMAMYDTSESEIDIKVVGYQWYWSYEYLGDDLSFYSKMSTPMEQIEGKAEKGEHYLLEVDNEVVIPINKKVRFLFTSDDVIHSWWVPDLAVKKDAIPGFINESWAIAKEPGVYRGQCTELCGKNHGFMPVVVRAVTEPEYEQWKADKKAEIFERLNNVSDMSMDQLMSMGEKVYAGTCAACHMANGQGMPPVFPAITNSKIANGPIDEHTRKILFGVPGTAMASYSDQLSPAEIAAVVTYQRNGLGNSVGDKASPKAVKDLKEQK